MNSIENNGYVDIQKIAIQLEMGSLSDRSQLRKAHLRQQERWKQQQLEINQKKAEAMAPKGLFGSILSLGMTILSVALSFMPGGGLLGLFNQTASNIANASKSCWEAVRTAAVLGEKMLSGSLNLLNIFSENTRNKKMTEANSEDLEANNTRQDIDQLKEQISREYERSAKRQEIINRESSRRT